MERLLKYLDLFENSENVPYKVFEEDFQNEMFECKFADTNWSRTFEKYNLREKRIDETFTDEEIANANIELLGAMMTYIHRGVTHWSQDSLLDYRQFFIKALKRLKKS